MHGVEAKGVDCPAIDGLDEASEVAGDVDDKSVLDAALIAAAQAVEHYEITRYGTLIAWAQTLGRGECASVLQQKSGETGVRPVPFSKRNHLSSHSVTQTPAQIPPARWQDVALRVFHGFSEDRIPTISGGVTFFVLLALFPGLAGLISLYGLIADSSTVGQHLSNLEGVLPEGGMQILRDQLQQLTSQPPQKLGLATLGTLAISLWSANGGTKAIFEGLNSVYEEHEKRSFIKLNAISHGARGCARP